MVSFRSPRVLRAGEGEALPRPRSSTCWPCSARGGGRVVRRERIMAEVWETANWFGSTKTLDVHVSLPSDRR